MIRSRRQLAYEAITHKILSGELRPGSRISEVPVAEELRMSRGSVREAINQLSGEGLVEQAAGLGAFVTRLNAAEIAHIYEMREILEGHVAEKAALTIDDGTLSRLEQVLTAHRQGLHEFRDRESDQWDPNWRVRMLKIDLKFHQILASCTRNSRLVKTINELHTLARVLCYQPQPVSAFGLRWLATIWREHHRVFRALKRRDPVAARAMMVAHIRQSLQRLLSSAVTVGVAEEADAEHERPDLDLD
jgi:DNA-binding GntR family transcriptional regulator